MWGTEKQMKMVREVILETEKMPGVEKAYESPYPPPRMSRVLNAEAAVNVRVERAENSGGVFVKIAQDYNSATPR